MYVFQDAIQLKYISKDAETSLALNALYAGVLEILESTNFWHENEVTKTQLPFSKNVSLKSYSLLYLIVFKLFFCGNLMHLNSNLSNLWNSSKWNFVIERCKGRYSLSAFILQETGESFDF